jgi:8-oxo-dGTP diphosphatase
MPADLRSWDGDQVLSRAEYLASLPRRRIAAGALIRDQTGRICLVDPTYKDFWQLPGGTVEADESPSAGCRREVREELGLEIDLGPMLCLDWIAGDHEDPHGALIFVYDGGVLDESAIGGIVTPPDELHGFRFVPVDQLGAYLSDRNQRRVQAALEAVGGPVIELDRDLDRR